GLSAVKTDAKLTTVGGGQGQAVGKSGGMDHDGGGSFANRIASAHIDSRGEKTVAGAQTWGHTLCVWEKTPGHNHTRLRPGAAIVGVAGDRNENTRYKVYWAMVIGRKEVKTRAVVAASRSLPTPVSAERKERSVARGSTQRSTEESSVGTLLMRAVT